LALSHFTYQPLINYSFLLFFSQFTVHNYYPSLQNYYCMLLNFNAFTQLLHEKSRYDSPQNYRELYIFNSFEAFNNFSTIQPFAKSAYS